MTELLFLLTLVVCVTIKSMGLAKRAGVPSGKDCHPLLVLTAAEEKGSGSPWSPTPILVKL